MDATRDWSAARRLAAIALIGCGMGSAPASRALDIDPGDYTALPVGVNAFVLYYQYADRNALYSRGTRVPGSFSLSSQVGIARYLRVVKIDERWTVDPQVLLPFGRLKAGKDLAPLGDASGTGDVILATAFKYKIDEKAGEVFGVTPFLFLPTGSYDAGKPLNLGENRWRFTMQAGYTRPLSDKFRWDVIGDVTVYGDNTRCRAACGSASDQNLKQEPLYQLQTHLRYGISSVFFLAGTYSHVFGGETSVAGVAQDDKQRTSYLRLHAGYFLDPATQILLTVGKDISVENGLRENRRLNLRFFKAF